MRLLLVTLIFISGLAFGQLHTFSNGTVADAEKINENFSMAAHKIYSGDTYLGRLLPWTMEGSALGITDQKFMFNYSWAGRLQGPSYYYSQGLYYTDRDCAGLGYIWELSIQPYPKSFRGVRGRVYIKDWECEDTGGFSPSCAEEPPDWTTLGIYVDYNNPLDTSVLPQQLYKNEVNEGCVSSNPTSGEQEGSVFYQELQNVPSITGIPGVVLPNPSIDIGLN